MSDPDRWHYHAYDHAFRRIVLQDLSGKSPVDPEGEWFAADLVVAAENFYHALFTVPLSRPPAHVIRDEYERRPTREWSLAELQHAKRDLASEAAEQGVDEIQMIIRRLQRKWKEAFKPTRYKDYVPTPVAKEITSTPERAAELLRMLEQRDGR